MTPLKALAHQCNLSLKETAAFLGIPESTATAYWKGQRTTGPQLADSIRELSTLARHVGKLADTLASEIVRRAPKKPGAIFQIVLATHPTPKAVKPLGLPFPSVFEAVLSRVMAQLPEDLASVVIFDPAATDDLEIR